MKLSGFGNFQLRDKPQRPGRNPKPARRFPSPRAGWSRSTPAKAEGMVDDHYASKRA